MYDVEITDLALTDAEEYVAYIRELKKEPDSADRWLRGLVAAIVSLETNPERCPKVPEKKEFSFIVRHLLYHSHRIVFRVEKRSRRVTVLRVYHASRHGLRGPEASQ